MVNANCLTPVPSEVFKLKKCDSSPHLDTFRNDYNCEYNLPLSLYKFSVKLYLPSHFGAASLLSFLFLFSPLNRSPLPSPLSSAGSGPHFLMISMPPPNMLEYWYDHGYYIFMWQIMWNLFIDLYISHKY